MTIRGPKEDAERAEKMLLNLAKDRELSSFEDSVTAKSEFHRFLIGRGGTRIKKVLYKECFFIQNRLPSSLII